MTRIIVEEQEALIEASQESRYDVYKISVLHISGCSLYSFKAIVNAALRPGGWTGKKVKRKSIPFPAATVFLRASHLDLGCISVCALLKL